MSEALHMIRIGYSTEKLFRSIRDPDLFRSSLDLGYLVHCHFAEQFGTAAPAPFFIDEKQDRVDVLGYSGHSAEELVRESRNRRAGTDGTSWQALVSKPMPAAARLRDTYAYRVRICPVIRKLREGPVYGRGAEIDAFLAASEMAGADLPVDREAVYRDWMTSRFQGAAELLSAGLVSFRRSRLVRFDASRKKRTLDRPDATVEGVLRVKDPDRFAALLRQGIGRHRAFGFGMVLLRSSGSPGC